MRDDIKQNRIFRDVAKINKNIDPYIVESICKIPFSFVTKVIRDNDDERDIMIAGFGKFRLKSKLKGRKAEKAAENEIIVERKKNKAKYNENE